MMYEDPHDLIPPHSIEAERSVLGCSMSDPALCAMITSKINGEEFFQPAHRILFESIYWLTNHSCPVDIVTVIDRLSTQNNLEASGGPGYVGSLTNIVPTFANAEQYCEIVKEKARLRRMLRMGIETISAVRHGKKDSVEIVEWGMTQLINNAKYSPDDEPVDIAEGIYENERYYKGLSSGKIKPPVKLGFRLLDELLMLMEGNLLVVGGRPSHGKTSFAVGVALNLINNGRKVLFISAEMNKREMTHRFIAGAADVSIGILRKGNVRDIDRHPLVKALIEKKNLLKLACPATLSDMDVRRILKREALQYGLPDIVIVDYVQRMKYAGRTEDRRLQIAGIANNFRDLLLEMSIPGILLSQLTPPIGKDRSQNKPPTLYDLKEAGELENVADAVGLIHRVDNDKELDEWDIDFLLEKNRNGPLGDIRFSFVRKTAKFIESNLQGRTIPNA